MDNTPIKGWWIVLRWDRKPKKLGTGFYWRQITQPDSHATAVNFVGSHKNLRVWPANKYA